MDLPDAYYGNVRDMDLRDAFRNSPACAILRRPAEYGICLDCGNAERCGGGCRAAAFALGGHLSAQDRSCPVRQALPSRRIPEAL